MSGTVAGGRKARDTNKANNPNFYREIGKLGGTVGRTGGFWADRELARRAGAIGGKISKRGPSTRVSVATTVSKPVKKSLGTKIKEVFNHG